MGDHVGTPDVEFLFLFLFALVGVGGTSFFAVIPRWLCFCFAPRFLLFLLFLRKEILAILALAVLNV